MSEIINFYGRRKGKRLSQRQQDLIDNELPKIQFNQEHCPDPMSAFHKKYDKLHLEIGFGGGEHLLHIALANPDIAYIGAEPFINGVGKFMNLWDTNGRPENIRLINDDILQYLPKFPHDSINMIYLLFPDPWNKAKHANRRFINTNNLPLLKDILVNGSILQFASDHAGYQEWLIEHISADSYFQFSVPPQQCFTRPDDWFPTRYEQKALSKNIKCMYFNLLLQK